MSLLVSYLGYLSSQMENLKMVFVPKDDKMKIIFVTYLFKNCGFPINSCELHLNNNYIVCMYLHSMFKAAVFGSSYKKKNPYFLTNAICE